MGGCLWERIVVQGCLLDLKSNWREKIIKKGGVLEKFIREGEEFIKEKSLLERAVY